MVPCSRRQQRTCIGSPHSFVARLGLDETLIRLAVPTLPRPVVRVEFSEAVAARRIDESAPFITRLNYCISVFVFIR